MKYLPLILILFLSGCSSLGNINTTGSKTTTNYDDDGRVISQVQEETPIFDSQYHWTDTQKEVARSAAQADIARANNTAKIIKATQGKATTKTESVLIGIFGMQALERMKSSIPDALASLGSRPMNGYEALVESLGKIVNLGPTIGLTIAYREREKTAREVARNAGTNISVGGDGNSVSAETTSVNSEIHANTTGDNSPSTVNNNQSAKCPTGDCDDTQNETTDPVNGCDFAPPEECGDSPVCIEGTWKWSSDCSCKSHLAGKC